MEQTCITGKDDGTLVLYKNNRSASARLRSCWPDPDPLVVRQGISADRRAGTESYRTEMARSTTLPVVAWTDEGVSYSPDSDEPEALEVEPVQAARNGSETRQAAPAPTPVEEPVTSQQAHGPARRLSPDENRT
jgi:hypothetical protein